MKKIYSLLVLLSTTVISFSQITGNWNNVGPMNISEDSHNSVQIERTSNDSLFIAYLDFSTAANSEVSVKKFNGTTWDYVGAQGWTGSLGPGVLQPWCFDIAITTSDEVMCAFNQTTGSSDFIRIYKFDGTNWVPVGGAITVPSSHVTKQLNLEILNGTPWVSYVTISGGTAFIKTSEFDGTNWVNHNPSPLGQDEFGRIDMAYAGGSNHLTFRDATGKIKVMTYNGTMWLDHLAGGSPFTLTSYDPVLKSNGNDLYLGFLDQTYELHLFKDFGGSAWQEIATGGFTGVSASYHDIVVPSVNEIYVSYVDYNDDQTAKVKKYDGTTWQTVGTSLYAYQEKPLSITQLSTGEPIVALQSSDGTFLTPIFASILQFEACNTTSDLTTSLSGETISANQTGATYQWLDCNNSNSIIAGATSQSFTATTNGDYACEITNGCKIDTTACVNISTLTGGPGSGIDDKDRINISLYPNPTNGQLFIQTTEVITIIQLTDINGRLLIQTNSANDLNLSDFESGIYLVKIETENGTFVSKVIKK